MSLWNGKLRPGKKMILKMEVVDADKKVVSTEEMEVSSNGLNRVTAPQLHGVALYHLKKNKKVEIKCEDGSIFYTLEDKTINKVG